MLRLPLFFILTLLFMLSGCVDAQSTSPAETSLLNTSDEPLSDANAEAALNAFLTALIEGEYETASEMSGLKKLFSLEFVSNPDDIQISAPTLVGFTERAPELFDRFAGVKVDSAELFHTIDTDPPGRFGRFEGHLMDAAETPFTAELFSQQGEIWVRSITIHDPRLYPIPNAYLEAHLSFGVEDEFSAEIESYILLAQMQQAIQSEHNDWLPSYLCSDAQFNEKTATDLFSVGREVRIFKTRLSQNSDLDTQQTTFLGLIEAVEDQPSVTGVELNFIDVDGQWCLLEMTQQHHMHEVLTTFLGNYTNAINRAYGQSDSLSASAYWCDGRTDGFGLALGSPASLPVQQIRTVDDSAELAGPQGDEQWFTARLEARDKRWCLTELVFEEKSTSETAQQFAPPAELVWADGLVRTEISAETGLWSPTAHELLTLDCDGDPQQIMLVTLPDLAEKNVTPAGNLSCRSGLTFEKTTSWLPNGDSFVIKKWLVDGSTSVTGDASYLRVTRDGEIAAESAVRPMFSDQIVDFNTASMLISSARGADRYQLLDQTSLDTKGTFGAIGTYQLTEQSIFGTAHHLTRTAAVEIALDTLEAVESVPLAHDFYNQWFALDAPVHIAFGATPDRSPGAASEFIGVAPDGTVWMIIDLDGIHWLAYYAPERPNVTQVVAIIDRGGAVFSPSGESIAFSTYAPLDIREDGTLTSRITADRPAEQIQVYVVDLPSLQVVHQQLSVYTFPAENVMSWSPDGQHLLILTKYDGHLEPNTYDIVRLSEQNIRASIDVSPYNVPSWSPDSQHILYLTGAEQNWHLWDISAETTKQLTLAGGQRLNGLLIPSTWSYDGSHLLLTETIDRNLAKLHLLTIK
ncbi:MAG: TolB family protein [Candidatus Promineifilaceae bacterium]